MSERGFKDALDTALKEYKFTSAAAQNNERLRVPKWSVDDANKMRGATNRMQSLDKSSRDDIINSKNMSRKAKGKDYIEPMPKKQLHKIMKSFRKNGGVIQMDEYTNQYLDSKDSEGITYNDKTILLRTRPGRASVFEEFIHTEQYRNGR